MRKHAAMHLGKRRENHHSTHPDGTPRTNRREGSRARATAAATSDVQEALDTQSSPAIRAASSPAVITSSSEVRAVTTLRAASSSSASLPIVISSRSSVSSSKASSSNALASVEAPSSTASTIPHTASKFIPAVLASVFVVLAAVFLVFCLHRRRKLAKRREALTSLAPSPYQVKDDSDPSFDEKAYPYSNTEPQELLSQSHSQQPRSFFSTIRDTIRRKSTKNSFLPPPNQPWQSSSNNQRSQTPPIAKMPPMTQIPSYSHDPFRDGFGPGAAQLATGLASTTMTSQTSQESHSTLSHKQSLSSNASTSVARRWPTQIRKDGHESLSAGPNVRTLYSGVHLEQTEEEQDVFAQAYGNAMVQPYEQEELATTAPLSIRSVRSSQAGRYPVEQGRQHHLSQSTDGRSIRFGTLKSQSDTGSILEEPAWQRA